MEHSEILHMVDHTLLKQTATWDQIKEVCDDATRFQTASICIPPCYVKKAADYLKGKMKVCTVIGFPNGNTTTACKAFEAKEAIANGASEVDMVINIGMVKAGDYDGVLREIQILRDVSKGYTLKVIIECCLLTDEEKAKLSEIVTEAGADFIKTSTGFSTGGATVSDVKILADHVGPNVKVKASGGIHSCEEAEALIAAGASRIGASRLVTEEKKLS